MFKFSALLIPAFYIAASALDYSISDSYNNSDYNVIVQNVSSISQLNSMIGTHSSKALDQTAMSYLNNQISALINVYSNTNQLLASGYLFKGMGDNDPWNRLVVIADGYDPGNSRHIDKVVSDANFKLIFSMSNTDLNYSGIGQGFDLLFVDFADGTGDVRKNAKAYLKLLEEANRLSNSNEISAIGISMGGVVVRLALLYAQKSTNCKPSTLSKVRKFLSIDAPQCGASAVNRELQKFIKDNASDVYNNKINTDAAKQLFYEHTEVNGSSEFDKFQSFLKNMGNYPKGYKMYAFANGTWDRPYNYSSAYYKILINVNIQFYIPGCPAPCTNLCYANAATYSTAYAQLNFSGNDFEPGSYRNVINELDNEVKPKLNTYNIYSLMEEALLNTAGLTSSIFTGCAARAGNKWLSTNKSDPNFKPTFIPLKSVFDLKSSTPSQLQNSNSLNALCSGQWTPFDKIYLCTTRNEHVYFTNEYASQIMSALKEPCDYKISASTSLLLNR